MSQGPDRPASGEVRAAVGDAPLSHLGRRLLFPFLLVLLGSVLLALVSDLEQLRAAVRSFDLRLLPPLLGLSLVNYMLRFGRWQLYLAEVDARLPPVKSLGVFLVGFLLSVTPGKAGELGKAWLVRELGGGPARAGVAAVLAERVTDLAGVLVLVALGALVLPGGLWLSLGAALAAVVGVAVLAWERAAHWTLARLERLPVIGPRVELLEQVYQRLHRLLSGRALVAGMLASIVAWGAEGIGFALVARDYAPDYLWMSGVLHYAVGALAGAISMLPGGLLASEGSLTALLKLQGLDLADAASVTLIVRLATLWFAVALGALALPFVLRWVRRYGRPAT